MYDFDEQVEEKDTRDFYIKRECEHANKSDVGRFAICECRNDGDTRLYIHRFDFLDRTFNKDGWWDTFTIASKPCKKGFHFVQIDAFVLDKTSYLNMRVTPMLHLGETVNDTSSVWLFFMHVGVLATSYHLYTVDNDRCNMEALFTRYCPGDSLVVAGKAITERFLNCSLSFSEIEAALEEHTDNEKVVEAIAQNPASFNDSHPLVMAKIMKMSREKAQAFLEDRAEQFDHLVHEEKLSDIEDGNILDKTETLLAYYKGEHKKQKAAKTAAKKEKGDS